MKMADIAEQLGISTVGGLPCVAWFAAGIERTPEQGGPDCGGTRIPHPALSAASRQSAAGTLQGRIAVVKGSYFSDSDPVAALIRSSVLQRLNERKVPFEVVPFERLEAEPALLDDCRGILSDYSCKPGTVPPVCRSSPCVGHE